MPVWLLPIISGGKSVLGFFLKPPGSYIAMAAACLIALWWYGQHEFNRGAASVVQKQQIQAAKVTERQINITYHVSLNFERIKFDDQSATNKLLDEVAVAVTPAIDLSHPVPCGFVRLFNAAAHDPIPESACEPDDAASGVALSEVARTTVENDGQYDILAHQLAAIQEWIRQQQAVAPK